MIHDVQIQSLRQISDKRGTVLHMLRCDSPAFESFGEIYFSTVNPGFIKAWNLHSRMVLNYCVPLGNIQLVLYDDRNSSLSYKNIQQLAIGMDNYCLVTIPAGIWSGFYSLGPEQVILANCSSIPHDPTEISRIDLNDPYIPFTWPFKSL